MVGSAAEALSDVTMVMRTMKASRATATARPSPRAAMTESVELMKPANTQIMMMAAAVMTLALYSKPVTTA
ncbi:hypothetical protein HUF15_38590 [Streptomyces samsunensis]|uniref:hypothetical protein n=1 Tax=Streptomyces malaysiensis TaxID=92644 RepID=UPI000852EC74|nr:MULTISPECIES: hypothetical protein [Streptomyces]NUH42568.1 hypothetical protein [Streptomyces samsunensis]